MVFSVGLYTSTVCFKTDWTQQKGHWKGRSKKRGSLFSLWVLFIWHVALLGKWMSLCFRYIQNYKNRVCILCYFGKCCSSKWVGPGKNLGNVWVTLLRHQPWKICLIINDSTEKMVRQTPWFSQAKTRLATMKMVSNFLWREVVLSWPF